MWTSRLFWTLYLPYLLLIVVATFAGGVLLSHWRGEQVASQIDQRLHAAALRVRHEVGDRLAEGRTEALQARTRQLALETGVRVTLVALDGEVLAESECADLNQVASLDNHMDRVELVQAIARGHAAARRRSPTLGQFMSYVALRVDQDARPIGVVRTSVLASTGDEAYATVRVFVWLGAVIVGFAVAAFTYVRVARTARQVHGLLLAADALAAGKPRSTPPAETQDELGLLMTAFNRMTRQLSARESSLLESNQRFAAVLGGMAEGVIAVDERERIVFANSAAGRLFHFVPAAAEGRPLLESVRSHQLHHLVTDTWRTRTRGRLEVEFGNHTRRVVAVTSAMLPGEPAPLVVLVLHDVTELRRLESLRRDFVANVSHELKTPLSSIKAYAETLSQGAINDPENNMRFLHCIEEHADRLHQLILDLLSLARIESGRQAFEMAAIPVAGVVRSCLAVHEAVARAKQIELQRGDGPPEIEVWAEEEGVKEILNNLVDNAIKYTPDSGRVWISWRLEGSSVLIDVGDTGIGIPAEHLPRVFERFYRVDKARSRELGGTGLGLSIVKHLAQAFGGSVQVVSQPDKGSVFTVTLIRA